MSPKPLPQLTDQEYEALDFEAVRCNSCTPLCMNHVHFLYRDEVLWACHTKLRRQKQDAR